MVGPMGCGHGLGITGARIAAPKHLNHNQVHGKNIFVYEQVRKAVSHQNAQASLSIPLAGIFLNDTPQYCPCYSLRQSCVLTHAAVDRCTRAIAYDRVVYSLTLPWAGAPVL